MRCSLVVLSGAAKLSSGSDIFYPVSKLTIGEETINVYFANNIKKNL